MQQVNLYQPTQTSPSTGLTGWLTSRSLLTILGLMLASMIAITAFATRAVRALEAQVEVARDRQQAQSVQLDQQAQRSPAPNTEQLRATLEQTRVTLSDHQHALELLRTGQLGGLRGFSARLVALANQRVDGLWLDTIVFGSLPGVQLLRGYADHASLVPTYLQQLTTEPAIRGMELNTLQIVSATAATPSPPSHGDSVKFTLGQAQQDRSAATSDGSTASGKLAIAGDARNLP